VPTIDSRCYNSIQFPSGSSTIEIRAVVPARFRCRRFAGTGRDHSGTNLIHLEDLNGNVAPTQTVDARIDDDTGFLLQKYDRVARAERGTERVSLIQEAAKANAATQMPTRILSSYLSVVMGSPRPHTNPEQSPTFPGRRLLKQHARRADETAGARSETARGRPYAGRRTVKTPYL
jgi:hypothetical protein